MQALSTLTSFFILPFRQWRKRHAPKSRPRPEHEALYAVEQCSVGRALVFRVKNRATGRIVASWPTYQQANEHASRMDAYFCGASVNGESIAQFHAGVRG